MPAKKLTFESGMEQLEAIAAQLEGGDLPLEDSLAAYEKAVQLSRKLQAMLDEGDRRIQLLTQNGLEDVGEEELT